MSNRSLVELNHDIGPNLDDTEDLIWWAKRVARYIRSGDESDLPAGVTLVHRRHHSEPCPVRDKANSQ